MGAPWRISSRLLAQLRAEAVASPGEEVCGLLWGGESSIDTAEPCRNVAADPSRRFEIDPAALLAAHRRSRTGGRRLVGWYHSHPGGDATPSACDAASAAPDGMAWLIIGAREARAWRATRDGLVQGRFDPIALVVDAGCASPDARPKTSAR